MNNVNEIFGFHKPDDVCGYMSNWYDAEFELANQKFSCVEQYMMYRKVMLGGRKDLAQKIMQTTDPGLMKSYAGPDNFSEYINISKYWDKNSKHIVKCAVRAKFVQNPILLDKLMSTGNALLCECSKSDTKWGIGIDLRDEYLWKDPTNWTGKNYLGRILMELRTEFRTEINYFGGVLNIKCLEDGVIPEWGTIAGQLRYIPMYHNAIKAYAAQLEKPQRKYFYTQKLCDFERNVINNNEDFTIVGFYEMKQEIYETAVRSNFKR